MLKLERQLVELQNCMYDSVTHNFDRVSGLHDNGMTPPQMQDGDQTAEITHNRLVTLEYRTSMMAKAMMPALKDFKFQINKTNE